MLRAQFIDVSVLVRPGARRGVDNAIDKESKCVVDLRSRTERRTLARREKAECRLTSVITWRSQDGYRAGREEHDLARGRGVATRVDDAAQGSGGEEGRAGGCSGRLPGLLRLECPTHSW